MRSRRYGGLGGGGLGGGEQSLCMWQPMINSLCTKQRCGVHGASFLTFREPCEHLQFRQRGEFWR